MQQQQEQGDGPQPPPSQDRQQQPSGNLEVEQQLPTGVVPVSEQQSTDLQPGQQVLELELQRQPPPQDKQQQECPSGDPQQQWIEPEKPASGNLQQQLDEAPPKSQPDTESTLQPPMPSGTSIPQKYYLRYEGNNSKRWDGKTIVMEREYCEDLVDNVGDLVPGKVLHLPYKTKGVEEAWRAVLVETAKTTRVDEDFEACKKRSRRQPAHLDTTFESGEKDLPKKKTRAKAKPKPKAQGKLLCVGGDFNIEDGTSSEDVKEKHKPDADAVMCKVDKPAKKASKGCVKNSSSDDSACITDSKPPKKTSRVRAGAKDQSDNAVIMKVLTQQSEMISLLTSLVNQTQSGNKTPLGLPAVTPPVHGATSLTSQQAMTYGMQTINPALLPQLQATSASSSVVPAPSGTISAPSGTVLAPSNTISAPSGTVPAPFPVPFGMVPAPSGTVPAPSGTVPAPSGTVLAPSNTISAPSGMVPAPSGMVPVPFGMVPAPSGMVPAPSGTISAPSGTVPAPSGTIYAPSGTVPSRVVPEQTLAASQSGMEPQQTLTSQAVNPSLLGMATQKTMVFASSGMIPLQQAVQKTLTSTPSDKAPQQTLTFTPSDKTPQQTNAFSQSNIFSQHTTSYQQRSSSHSMSPPLSDMSSPSTSYPLSIQDDFLINSSSSEPEPNPLDDLHWGGTDSDYLSWDSSHLTLSESSPTSPASFTSPAASSPASTVSPAVTLEPTASTELPSGFYPPPFDTPPKLTPVEEILASIPGKDVASLRLLAVALARDAIFGREEWAKTSLSGRGKLGKASTKKMIYIKSLIESRIQDKSKVEREMIWSLCRSSMSKSAQGLRSRKKL